MNLVDLKKPFNPLEVYWRVGATNSEKSKGIALAYIDARTVMERLDSVCGPENWQAEYPFLGCCRIGIRTTYTTTAGDFGAIHRPITIGDWVWKSNGAGQSDIEAEKGQYSDAFKRAAVLWGIGRYIYDLPNTWFPIEAYGKSYRFSEDTLAELTKRLAKWQDNYFKGSLWEGSNRDEIIELVRKYHDSGDIKSLDELLRELSPEQASDMWRAFPAPVRSRITEDLSNLRGSRNE